MAKFTAARQARFGAYASLYTLIVIAILGGINYLAAQYNKSIDSTANKRYSLSDQTKKVVANLKQDVTFEYFDKTTGFGTAKETLDRYANLSNRIKVTYVDPVKKPDVARAEGVRSFGTLVVRNNGNKQEAKSLSEEEITGALIRSTKTGTRTACFVAGSGEHRLDATDGNGYSQFKDSLERNNYTTRTISLIEKPEVPKECSVTVIGGPKTDYAEPMVNAVKSYAEGGGHLLFLLDPPVEGNTGDPSLGKLLSGWGVTPGNDLIVDLSETSAYFGEAVPFAAHYESQPIARGMNDVATAFPLARSLDVKGPAEKLFETSDNSYAVTTFKMPIKLDPKTARKGPFTLGAAGTVGNGGTQGRFVVLGSSNAAANQMLQLRQVGNRDLILNSMNWLSADEELISIRPKDPDDRRLNMSGRQIGTLLYATMIIFPAFLIAAGFMVWAKRR